MSDTTHPQRAVIGWGIAFLSGMFGAAFVVARLHLGPLPAALLILAAMLLLVPFVRATERRQASCGALSPAARAYNRRSLIWAFSYAIALVGAITIHNQLNPGGALAWVVAVLPALPILYFLWAMARYLLDESDEYLRMRVVIAALVATGLLLAIATVWGFLESFGLVRHVEPWAAVPVWAIGLGLGQLLNRWRGA